LAGLGSATSKKAEGAVSVLVKGCTLWLAVALVPTQSVWAQSGWYRQPPWPTTEQLRAVSTPDSSTLVAVGDRATIVRSTDGGETWTHPDGGTSNQLLGVSFADAQHGTIVGAAGTILRTTDSGETWAPQQSGTNATLLGVWFTDANTGTAVGAIGTILR